MPQAMMRPSCSRTSSSCCEWLLSLSILASCFCSAAAMDSCVCAPSTAQSQSTVQELGAQPCPLQEPKTLHCQLLSVHAQRLCLHSAPWPLPAVRASMRSPDVSSVLV